MKKKQKSIKLKPVNNSTFELANIKRIPHNYMLSAIYKKFPDRDIPLKGFTLPGTSYLFERELLEVRHKDSLVCIEHDPLVYERSKEIKDVHRLNNINLLYISDVKYFKESKELFNYIWLDYCGYLAKTKIKVFENILKNNLTFDAGNPILGFTFMGGMDFSSKKTIDEYANETMSLELIDRPFNVQAYDVRMSGIPMWLNYVAKQQNKTLLPKTILRYRDRSRNPMASPMLFFIFEVYNGIINFTFNNTDINDIITNSLH